MPAYVETVNQIISLGIILIECLVVFLAITFIFFRSRKNPILLFFKEYGILLVFLTALGSVLTSLFYSNVVGFPPCELCWIQRLFIYPQVLMAGYLLWKPSTKRTQDILRISFIFAVLGSLVSIYHTYIVNGGESSIACANNAAIVSCTVRYVYEFGYITIPVMALSAGLFMVVLLANYRYITKQ
jgi:disulfide bond formation protein DsbB